MNLNLDNKNYSEHRYFVGLQKVTQTPKTRSFGWLSLSIFTISFFLTIAIKPTLVTIAKLNREIKDKTEASQQLQKKINAIVAAQDEYAKNSDNLPLLEEALPEKSEFPRLAYYFEQVATSSGVILKSLSFEKVEETIQNPKDSSSLTNLPLNFSLAVTGDYLKLKNFLNEIGTSRRILKIEGTTFSRVRKGESFELILAVSGRASFRKKV